MKKSTLLSLLTATSIVLTSAGTYALWDTTTTNTTAQNVTFRNPVTVTVEGSYAPTENDAKLNKTPTVSGTVKFNVSGNAGLADTLTIVPKVSGASSDLSDFTFTIKDGLQKLGGEATSGFVDTDISATNTYTVEVTPNITGEKEHDDAIISKIANNKLNIELTATLSKSGQS